MENSVELIGIYGSDEIIACSAWTSTSRNLSEEKRNRIPKLLNDLWNTGHEDQRHGTPFEKGIVHFLVDSDIASHIHMLKHRISSMNAESARYKELKEDKFHIPEDWDVVIQKSIYFDNNTLSMFSPSLEHTWKDVIKKYTELGNKLYHQALHELKPILGTKRAKESARFFKTYNSQIECDIMFNMRSFYNFQKLRNSENAQKEIREIAEKMLELVRETGKFNYTLKAMGL